MYYNSYDNLEEALKQAARDHNRGAVADEIIDNNRKYNHQEIIVLCNQLGLLR